MADASWEDIFAEQQEKKRDEWRTVSVVLHKDDDPGMLLNENENGEIVVLDPGKLNSLASTQENESVHPGDVLASINSDKPNSMVEIYEALKSKRPLWLKFERDSKALIPSDVVHRGWMNKTAQADFVAVMNERVKAVGINTTELAKYIGVHRSNLGKWLRQVITCNPPSRIALGSYIWLRRHGGSEAVDHLVPGGRAEWDTLMRVTTHHFPENGCDGEYLTCAPLPQPVNLTGKKSAPSAQECSPDELLDGFESDGESQLSRIHLRQAFEVEKQSHPEWLQVHADDSSSVSSVQQKEVRIGDEFQAVVPDFDPNLEKPKALAQDDPDAYLPPGTYQGLPLIRRVGFLAKVGPRTRWKDYLSAIPLGGIRVWNPNRLDKDTSTSEALWNFVYRRKDSLWDEAYTVLAACDYNFEDAESLMQQTSSAGGCTMEGSYLDWLREEVHAFQVGIDRFGKAFGTIQAGVRSRTVPEVVQYFYGAWKRKQDYKAWKAKHSGTSTAISEFHNDVCEFCDQGGDLLCCDSCSLAFHLHCLRPPLLQIPEGDWACPICEGYNLSPEELERRRDYVRDQVERLERLKREHDEARMIARKYLGLAASSPLREHKLSMKSTPASSGVSPVEDDDDEESDRETLNEKRPSPSSSSDDPDLADDARKRLRVDV